jgi:N-acetyl-beta-hexosaminidase
LSINETNIESIGKRGAGVIYGFLPFLQLRPAGKINLIEQPELSINDSPRFRWRGIDGAQANLWNEYMLLPRLCALSEVVGSPKEKIIWISPEE